MSNNEIIFYYFNSNSGKKKPEIEKIVDRMLIKYGGICDADIDDFYSLAGVVFTEIIQTYDPERGVPFRSFLKRCLSNKIKEMITARNAYKRTAQREAMSLSTPIMGCDSEDIEIGETISDSKTEVENRVFGNMLSESTTRYLDRLSRKQRVMAELIMNGGEEADIMRKMDITYAEYHRILESMRDFELSSILIGKE